MARSTVQAEDDLQGTATMIGAVGTVIGTGLLGLAFKVGFLDREPSVVVFGTLLFAGFVVLGQTAFMSRALRALAQLTATVRRLEGHPVADSSQQRETAA